MKDARFITVGAASKIEVDDVEVGYTEGDVEFERTSELLRFDTGVPRVLAKQAPITTGFRTTFGISQITGPNIAIAALDLSSVSVPGGVQNVTGQQRSFAAPLGHGIEQIRLDQPGVPGSYDSITVTDGSEPYLLGSDYLVDAQAGILYRNPSGDIPPGGEVTLGYDYTRLAYDDLPIATVGMIVTRKFYFEHIGPDGQKIEVWIWRGQAAASFTLTASAENWWRIPVELEATDDSANHPGEGFGRIRVTYPLVA